MAEVVEVGAADPLAGTGFDAIYSRDIEPELIKREAERKKAVGRFWLFAALTVVVCIVEGVVLHFGGLGVTLMVFTLVGGLVLAFLPLGKVRDAAKLGTINALCAPMGLTYTPSKFDPPAFGRLVELKLLPASNDRDFQDYFLGNHKGREFHLYEATLQTGVSDRKSTVFSGQLFVIEDPRKLPGVTVLLRDGGFLKMFQKPKGLEHVAIEDPAFEKMFEAYGSDPAEARSVLTPGFMQRLVDLEKTYGGKRIRCAFTEGWLMIAIEGRNKFELGSSFKSLVDRARVEGIARDIAAIFRVIEAI